MTILSNLAHLPDLSMRQMVFFYELCKMGVVRFDLNNAQHKLVLGHMLNLLKESCKKSRVSESSIRQKLYALIMFQLVKHAVPEERSASYYQSLHL